MSDLLVAPPLDAAFRPAGRVRRTLERRIAASGVGVPVEIALQQPGGSVVRHTTVSWPDGHPDRAQSDRACLRLVKLLLWARGGDRVYVDGPDHLVEELRRHYAQEATGRFDAAMVSAFYGSPLEMVRVSRTEMPAANVADRSLGGHLDGCRIGFDLGASDRKAAAVIDGEVVFSEEIAWDPSRQTDPQWHRDQVNDSLVRAAAHLPRVDAIGGSAAGVYVDNEVRTASLFRAVPPAAFEARVRGLFHELQAAWDGIPFVVVNDGQVTALAGAMAAGTGGLLGIAMGSSQAAGYVTRDRTLTPWLDELAFAPVDDSPDAPVDEWSGARGCGVQYFSQQAVARLLGPAGIEVDRAMSLPERLVRLQDLMSEGDPRAAAVHETIGTYLGYALIDYRELYDFDHLLLLGRVLTGTGGDVIAARAREVLRVEDGGTHASIRFHEPTERDKRHGQAVAAASLPALP